MRLHTFLYFWAIKHPCSLLFSTSFLLHKPGLQLQAQHLLTTASLQASGWQVPIPVSSPGWEDPGTSLCVGWREITYGHGFGQLWFGFDLMHLLVCSKSKVKAAMRACLLHAASPVPWGPELLWEKSFHSLLQSFPLKQAPVISQKRVIRYGQVKGRKRIKELKLGQVGWWREEGGSALVKTGKFSLCWIFQW